jgi:(p)ppGpp synthase/HD superfamily hydrolase
MKTKRRNNAPPRARVRTRSRVSARPALGPRFEEALAFANRLHATQKKKGTEVPYMAHLLGVTSIVLTAGADEDLAIAALLHDGPEDQGGRPLLRKIERKFGKRVAVIVDACTDTYDEPKPAWRPRKEKYIAGIGKRAAEARLVSAADKLHNCRQILEDHRQIGDAVFDRFTGKKEGTLWYYRALVEAYRHAGTNVIVEELDRVVTELERRARGAHPAGGGVPCPA